MLNIHLLRRLTDHRLKSLKRSLYGKRSSTYYFCECCNEQYIHQQPEYDRYCADIATISRIQMERKNG